MVNVLCFKSSLVVKEPFNLCFLMLPRKRDFRKQDFNNSLWNIISVVNMIVRISLIFFFLYQILVVQAIAFDLGAIYDLSMTVIKLTYFTVPSPKIGWIFFRMSMFLFDQTFFFDRRHPITNKCFLFHVIFLTIGEL